jgi:hypothetical protein
MRKGKTRRRSSSTAFLALCIGCASAAAQTSAPEERPGKCPEGYEKLCKALAQPPAGGGVGSAAGTGGKAMGGGEGRVLENQDFQVKTPGAAVQRDLK